MIVQRKTYIDILNVMVDMLFMLFLGMYLL